MSKKKSAKLELTVNPENYIKSGRARKLPIEKCMINSKWKEAGKANIFIIRKHVNDNITVAVFLVDTFCLGVKDTYYFFNIPDDEFYLYLEDMSNNDGLRLETCDYTLAHNIIYGALEFADDCGIAPHADFRLTKMILEEDDEDIELIDIEFGKDGKPFLFADKKDPKTNYYLNRLNEYVGEGNYDFTYLDFFEDNEEFGDDFDEDDPDYSPLDLENWNEEDWLDFINVTSTSDSSNFIEIADYIYSKTIAKQEEVLHQLIAEKTKSESMTITGEPIEQEYGKTKKEQDEAASIHATLVYENSRIELLTLEGRILEDIKKWPDNPIFVNYLFTLYQSLDNKVKAEEAAYTLKTNFPDYLFGRMGWAVLLLEKGEFEKVPEVFNEQYNLKSLYPERDVFHINEFITFNTIMCWYFLEKNDIYVANLYRDMIFELDIPRGMQMNDQVFFRLELAKSAVVKDLIDNAQQDEKKKKELIAMLMN